LKKNLTGHKNKINLLVTLGIFRHGKASYGWTAYFCIALKLDTKVTMLLKTAKVPAVIKGIFSAIKL